LRQQAIAVENADSCRGYGFDVVADGRGAEVASGEVLVVDVFGLERREEALGDSVVVAIAGAAHAHRDCMGGQDAAVVVAGVRATSVGVMHEARARPARTEGLIERREREVTVVDGARRPSNNPSGKQIEKHRQICRS
jgi:hypothetical protein